MSYKIITKAVTSYTCFGVTRTLMVVGHPIPRAETYTVVQNGQTVYRQRPSPDSPTIYYQVTLTGVESGIQIGHRHLSPMEAVGYLGLLLGRHIPHGSLRLITTGD